MNFNLVNDQHSALEISDLSELIVGQWLKEQAIFTFWWVLAYSKSAKAMSHVTMQLISQLTLFPMPPS
jgi:hypothetical protein